MQENKSESFSVHSVHWLQCFYRLSDDVGMPLYVSSSLIWNNDIAVVNSHFSAFLAKLQCTHLC